MRFLGEAALLRARRSCLDLSGIPFVVQVVCSFAVARASTFVMASVEAYPVSNTCAQPSSSVPASPSSSVPLDGADRGFLASALAVVLVATGA